eukprot:scaffold12082_cov70-Phaeocystis_antarctica.AAC.5
MEGGWEVVTRPPRKPRFGRGMGLPSLPCFHRRCTRSCSSSTAASAQPRVVNVSASRSNASTHSSFVLPFSAICIRPGSAPVKFARSQVCEIQEEIPRLPWVHVRALPTLACSSDFPTGIEDNTESRCTANSTAATSVTPPPAPLPAPLAALLAVTLRAPAPAAAELAAAI